MGAAGSCEVILGTRGSDLALTQARTVERALLEIGRTVRVQVVRTRGDEASAIGARPAGRKGVFTAELERALAVKEIDLAVHSAKDLPSEMPGEFAIAAVLPRGTVEDVVLTKTGESLAALRHGAKIGTGSIRRQRQLQWSRPDFALTDLRGNIPTRLRKFLESDWDAVVLARAGLERLKFLPPRFQFEGHEVFAEVLPLEIFVPAGGQGIIALQTRTAEAADFAPLNDPGTRNCLSAEREFLRLIAGDCGTPVGAHARMIDGEKMELRVQLFGEGAAPRMARREGTDPRKMAAEAHEAIMK